jgi:hypothetical protein
MPSTRPGSGADLSRRIERLEHKYDEVALVVARVEANQQHAEELNRERFEGVKQAIHVNSAKLDAFIARVEGMISGEVQTTATRQGAELVAEYQRRMGAAEADILALKSQNVRQSGVNAGIGQTFGTGKAIVVTAAAVVTAVVTVLGALHLHL